MFLGWHSGYMFPKVSLPTQCEFPRGGTSRVTTVTLVPREGNETLRLFATPLHAWERLASSQKADSVVCRRPFVASEYAVTCYVMTQHQSGLG